MSDRITVYYHRDCVDGVASAWIHERYIDVATTYVPYTHGDGLFPSTSKVWFLDCCPPADDLAELLSREEISLVTVLDHHKTTNNVASSLKLVRGDIPIRNGLEPIPVYAGDKITIYQGDGLYSGVSLVLNYLADVNVVDVAVLDLVDYITDRDLDIHDYTGCDAVHEVIYSQVVCANKYTDDQFAALDRLTEQHISEIIDRGKGIIEYKKSIIKSEAVKGARAGYFKFGGIDYFVTTFEGLRDREDFAAELLSMEQDGKLPDFVLFHSYNPHTRRTRLSFRSRTVNVRAIAESLGGGGHDHRAGVIIDDALTNYWSPEPHTEESFIKKYMPSSSSLFWMSVGAAAGVLFARH